MAEITEERVLDALRAVRDPDRGGDVVALGMVSGLNVTEGRVSFSLAIDPKDAARLEPLRRTAEACSRIRCVKAVAIQRWLLKHSRWTVFTTIRNMSCATTAWVLAPTRSC